MWCCLSCKNTFFESVLSRVLTLPHIFKGDPTLTTSVNQGKITHLHLHLDKTTQCTKSELKVLWARKGPEVADSQRVLALFKNTCRGKIKCD